EERVLDSEIRSLLDGANGAQEEADSYEEEDDDSMPELELPKAPVRPQVKLSPQAIETGKQKETVIATVKEPLPQDDQFSLKTVKSGVKSVPRVGNAPRNIEPPKLRTPGGNKVVSSISTMFDQAKSSEELRSEERRVGKECRYRRVPWHNNI